MISQQIIYNHARPGTLIAGHVDVRAISSVFVNQRASKRTMEPNQKTILETVNRKTTTTRKNNNNNNTQSTGTGNFVQIIDGSANGDIKVNRIYRINSNNVANHTKRWYKEYQVGNQLVRFKLDTGSDVDCIPAKIFKTLKTNLENENENYSVVDYNGNKVNVFGTVKLKCIDTKLKTEHLSHFIVVDDACEPIIGLESCERFGLVKRTDIKSIACLSQTGEEFLKNNRDVFEGLGKFPGKFTINMKENSKPVLHYKKRIPHSLLDRLRLHLVPFVKSSRGTIKKRNWFKKNYRCIRFIWCQWICLSIWDGIFCLLSMHIRDI